MQPIAWPAYSFVHDVFFDACPSGIGIVIQNVGGFHFPVDSLYSSVHIDYLELFAGLAALEMCFLLGICSVNLYGDNTAALAWLSKCFCVDAPLLPWLYQWWRRFKSAGINYFCQYVCSEENPADEWSRMSS